MSYFGVYIKQKSCHAIAAVTVSSQWIKQPFHWGLDHAHINNTLIWVGSHFTHDSHFLDGRQKLTVKCCFPVPKFQAYQRLRKHTTIKQSLYVFLEAGNVYFHFSNCQTFIFMPRHYCLIWQWFLSFSFLSPYYWMIFKPLNRKLYE